MSTVSQLLWLLGYGALRRAVVRSLNSLGREQKRDRDRILAGGTRIASLAVCRRQGVQANL
jgi:hypothetical protein